MAGIKSDAKLMPFCAAFVLVSYDIMDIDDITMYNKKTIPCRENVHDCRQVLRNVRAHLVAIISWHDSSKPV